MEMPELHVKQKKVRHMASFKPQWVKLPYRWAKALQRSNSASTFKLAHVILFEAFKREQRGHGERKVVLSTEVTGMNRATRKRAIAELVKLKLIKVKRLGKRAVKVEELY
jgi:hypothetical protein